MEPQLGFSIGSTVCPGLSKLIEECGEVCQIAGKLIATGGKPEHWDGSNLKVRMEEELADLMAAIQFFASLNELDHAAIEERRTEKLDKFCDWHNLQRKK